MKLRLEIKNGSAYQVRWGTDSFWCWLDDSWWLGDRPL